MDICKFQIGDKVKIRGDEPSWGWGGSLPNEIGSIVSIETIPIRKLFRKAKDEIFWIGVDFTNRRKYTDLSLAVEPHDLMKVE